MKYKFFTFIIALSSVMAACTSEEIGTQPDNPTPLSDEIVCIAEPKEFVGDIESRSKISFSKTSGMLFSWENSDQLTIFPEGNNDTRAIYQLNSLSETSPNKAHFNCPNFQLASSNTYYCFSKVSEDNPGNYTIAKRDEIKVTYAGQRQLKSGSSTATEESDPHVFGHLGLRDFMVSTGKCEKADLVSFQFKHLGYTLRMVLKGLPIGQKFKRIEVYDSEDKYRQPKRILNFDNNPEAWQPVDMEDETNKNAERMLLYLGPDKDADNDNSNDEGISPNSDGTIVAYMELPPFDFSKKDLVVNLVNADPAGINYYCTYIGTSFAAGKAYNRELMMKPVDKFETTIKVDYNWYYGNLASRATGDPGYEEKFEAPKYLYAFFCVNGIVEDVREFTNIPAADWSEPYESGYTKTIEYKEKLVFKPRNNEEANNSRLYIMASDTEFAHGIDPLDHRTETDVQKLIYSIPAQRTDESDADYQTRTQKFMRDLYSTPWEDNSNFIGWLKNPSQTVTLYHVAAKVDNQWNNTTTTALSGNFTITGVQSNNLSIFQPTANGTSPFTGTTTTSVSTPITGASAWNGREYFYLPQPSNGKYNIGIGGKSYTGFDFNDPNTITKAGGYTSWLRSQITIK